MKNSPKPLNQDHIHLSLDNVTFDFIRTEKKTEMVEFITKENMIIIFLKGYFRITSTHFNDARISHNKMITIAKNENFRITTSEAAYIIFIKFHTPASNTTNALLDTLRNIPEEDLHKGYALTLNKPIEEYMQLLKTYISSGLNYRNLIEINREEFLISLKHFYSKKELAKVFYPILHYANPFHKIIADKIDHISNVAALIEAANMSKSVFYKKFKTEFGITAKQWLNKQLGDKILKKITDKKTTPKDLMVEFNFTSPTHLNIFCKKQFRMTPSELIKNYGEKH